MDDFEDILGEIRSLVHHGSFDIIEKLLPLLNSQASQWWQNESVRSCLSSSRYLFDPSSNPPPQPELLRLWLKGEERALLRIAFEEAESLPITQWGEELEDRRIYQDGRECELLAWNHVTTAELEMISAWCIEHSHDAPPRITTEDDIRGVIPWKGWYNAASFWFEYNDNGTLLLKIDELEDMKPPHLIPTLESLFQIDQRILASAQPGRDWDFIEERELYSEAWETYIVLRTSHLKRE